MEEEMSVPGWSPPLQLLLSSTWGGWMRHPCHPSLALCCWNGSLLAEPQPSPAPETPAAPPAAPVSFEPCFGEAQ